MYPDQTLLKKVRKLTLITAKSLFISLFFHKMFPIHCRPPHHLTVYLADHLSLFHARVDLFFNSGLWECLRRSAVV